MTRTWPDPDELWLMMRTQRNKELALHLSDASEGTSIDDTATISPDDVFQPTLTKEAGESLHRIAVPPSTLAHGASTSEKFRLIPDRGLVRHAGDHPKLDDSRIPPKGQPGAGRPEGVVKDVSPVGVLFGIDIPVPVSAEGRKPGFNRFGAVHAARVRVPACPLQLWRT